MSKINIRLNEIFSAPANVAVLVTSVLVAGQSVVSGSTGIVPGRLSCRTDETGLARFNSGDVVLAVGRYEIVAQGASGLQAGLWYRVLIDVPDDSNTYEHTALIVSGADGFALPVPTVQPNGTDLIYGLVRLAGANFGGPSMRLFVQAAIQSLNTSTVLVDSASLVCGLEASKTYFYRAVLLLSTVGTVSGYKVGVNGPAGFTALNHICVAQDDANAGKVSVLRSAYGLVAARAVTAVADYGVELSGTVVNGVTAGNLAIQFAQNTSHGSDVSLRAGSSLLVWRAPA